MKMRTLFSLLFPLIFILNGTAQPAERNILKNAITKEGLSYALKSASEFLPLPKTEDPYWTTLDEEKRTFLISRGENYLDYDWPSLLARRYMDFDIDGNRTRYSSRYYDRRNALSDLCVAEIIENKGRFLDDIINGVWLILEETTWVVPAHSGGDKLHDINDVTVDLFSAETAGLLAWVDYFFGEEFDRITPLIRQRISQEVERRVIQSMLDHNDFWYMGYTGRIPNNWNPWIVSNWLTAVLILEKDETRRLESVWKALDVLDNYLNPHPADGGCDEGPSYWGHAGASLFDCLFLLDKATNGAVNVFQEPLIRNIGTYIYKINIDKTWYVNFADGSARTSHEPATLFRIGKAVGDKDMMAFSASLYRDNQDLEHNTGGRSPFGLRRLPNLIELDDLAVFTEDYTPELYYIFPDLEVAIAREHRDNEGFFFAIKGGYNNESHNHNDVGSFVVFYNGLPLFIDAGVGTYTRKTFSSERYKIWTMQSAYHNLPDLNGEMQVDGNEYRSQKFDIVNSKTESTVSMDISDAYPEYSYTPVWMREISLDRRKAAVILKDSWEQDKQLKRNQWHFMLAYKPEIIEDGLIKLSNGESELYFKYGKHFFPTIEKIELDDERLIKVWGSSLWRLNLTTGKKGLKGSETFIIQKNKK